MAFASVRSAEKREIVRRAAHEVGVELEVLVFDVTDASACDEALADLELYGLVNNSGHFNAGAVPRLAGRSSR